VEKTQKPHDPSDRAPEVLRGEGSDGLSKARTAKNLETHKKRERPVMGKRVGHHFKCAIVEKKEGKDELRKAIISVWGKKPRTWYKLQRLGKILWKGKRNRRQNFISLTKGEKNEIRASGTAMNRPLSTNLHRLKRGGGNAGVGKKSCRRAFGVKKKTV